MKLNRQEKEIVRRKFCAYCIKVLRGEALNYLDELERQRKREVNFSEILQKDLETQYCCDDYDMAENFTVMGRQVPVRDEWICKALKKLPIKKREIILMLYFLDMTEKEIAACLKLVQSTVHYHKDDSLRLIQAAIEGDAEAINQVLSYFQPFINSECKREYKDEFGRVHYVADEYMKRRMETKLITKILDFKIRL